MSSPSLNDLKLYKKRAELALIIQQNKLETLKDNEKIKSIIWKQNKSKNDNNLINKHFNNIDSIKKQLFYAKRTYNDACDNLNNYDPYNNHKLRKCYYY